MRLAIILAVGRDPIILDSRAKVLRSVGYIVETANCVSEAICRFQNGDFDAVVLCHSSPRTERDRITSSIRASGSRVPILFVSPVDEPSSLADATIDCHPANLLRAIETAVQHTGNALRA